MILPEAAGRRLRALLPVVLALLAVGVVIAVVQRRRPASAPVHLSDLKPTTATQGWGKLGLDRSVAGNPAWIGGQRFEKALGTHATSRICYALEARYSRFECAVGMDSETIEHGTSIAFRVLGDERVLYEGPVLSGYHEPVTIRLGIEGIHELCLLVEDGGDGISFDHADWGAPRVFE